MSKAFSIEKNKSRMIFTRLSDNRVAEFDLADGKCYSHYKNGNIAEVKGLQAFFRGYNLSDIKPCFTDEKYAEFINMVAEIEYKCSNIGTFLQRVKQHSHLEQFIKAGYKVPEIRRRFWNSGTNWRDLPTRPLSEYNKAVLKVIRKHELEINRTLESKIFNESYGDTLIKLDSIVGDDDISEWIYFMNRYASRFNDLIDMGYDLKRLIEYLEYVDQFEAYSKENAITTLRDYASMASSMTTGKINKYPKYLRTIHDITARNYRAFKVEHNDELFQMAVSKYADLKFTGKKYHVISPMTSGDMKNEGASLSHCVAGYVNNVIDGRSKILFLRSAEDIETPLVTLEVKGDRLIQARGNCNRSVTSEEREFLSHWCSKKKGLTYDY